eukprot:XP_763216.1 hypothetical protein [Theileria parva strain Muguga]
MFINFNIFLSILICVYLDLFFGFKCFKFQIFSYCLVIRRSGPLFNRNVLSYIIKSHNKFNSFPLKVKFDDDIKKIDFPIEREAPLKNVQIPPCTESPSGRLSLLVKKSLKSLTYQDTLHKRKLKLGSKNSMLKLGKNQRLNIYEFQMFVS